MHVPGFSLLCPRACLLASASISAVAWELPSPLPSSPGLAGPRSYYCPSWPSHRFRGVRVHVHDWGFFRQWLVEGTILSLWAFLCISSGPVIGLVFSAGGPDAVWARVTDGSIAVLPAVLTLVLGVWACLLVQRGVRASRYRWARVVPDVLVAIVTGLGCWCCLTVICWPAYQRRGFSRSVYGSASARGA